MTTADSRNSNEADLPVIQRVVPPPDAFECFLRLQSLPHCVFLDSALRRPGLGRYSFLAADPFRWLEIPVGVPHALVELETALAEFPASTLPDLPPFQGGAAGLLAYDLHHTLERIPPCRFNDLPMPALAMGLYDVVLAFDHEQEVMWIVSQGFPETEPAARRRRALARCDEFRRRLEAPRTHLRPMASGRPVAAGDLAPQFAVGDVLRLTSNFTREDYWAAVRRTVEYICAGDAFQVNLAQRLLYPSTDHPVALYQRLRACNPATFAGYLDLGEWQLASASPERFLRVRHGQVEARPIKGTRQRLVHVEASLFAADDLRQSEKDRAENVMIVDLLRNDLSRVCRPESICVTELCQLEVYEYVQHLVSAVTGRLREDCRAMDLVRAAFPGGSITGAPKVRAMEIIAELEPTPRGGYCGSLGYVGFDGSLDLNILIRTIIAGGGWYQMHVGGGITAQSDPRREYEETWHKATGLLRALPV